MRRRAPVPVSGAVEALARSLEPVTPLAAVQRAWPGCAGPVFAGRSTPTSVRGGVLTVACEAGAYAQELSLLAPEILARLTAEVDGLDVREIRVSGGGRRARR